MILIFGLLVTGLMLYCAHLSNDRDWYKKEYHRVLDEARPLFQREQREKEARMRQYEQHKKNQEK